MGKKMINKLYKTSIYILILTIILPILCPYFGQVLAITAGQKVVIPTDIEQTEVATYGYEDINWDPSTGQYKICEKWKQQGKKADENGWAYIVADTTRYLIALAPTFGRAGDYIDLYIKDGNSEKVIPCIMAEAKGLDQPNSLNDGAFLYNGIHLGHKYGNKCNVLEIQLKDESTNTTNSFLRTLVPIIAIQNGGSYFDHPDKPVGLTSTYTIGGGTSYARSEQKSEETFASVVLSFFRTLWSNLSTSFDNIVSRREDSDNIYYTQDPTDLFGSQDGGSNSNPVSTVGDANLMKTCENLTKYLMNKHVHYGWPYENLTRGDLEKNFNDPDYNVVCATYVAIALWQSGTLSLDFINRHSYNAADGIATMVQEAGWVNKGKTSDRREGDILVQPGTHAAISAGGLKVWEESTGCISRYGDAPTGEVHTHGEGYLSQFNVYRKE